jgi:predicted DNA-binding WGR domain protein
MVNMKLIKQTNLFYREGSSDKVYEVDLCEVSQNRYVVNFRYGRRGASLKEGSKTVSAVPLAQAQKLFDELVQSKVKKGYRELSDQSTAVATPARPARAVVSAADGNARNQAVLDHLSKKSNKKWPLERVIWRAGELKIREATPLLIKLIGSGKPLRDYCIAWSLGWCGDENAISALGRLYGDSSTTDAVRRVAGEALLKLSDDDTRSEFRSDMIEKLPPQLRESARKGPAEAFSNALADYLKEENVQRLVVLDTIYLIDNEHVRPALLTFLRSAPFKPNFFQRIRHIFKAAEYRRDAEVYGLIAYRFEKERHMFNNSGYSGRHISMQIDGRWEWIEVKKETQSPTSRLAYSSRTRTYMRKRVWRTLRRMGELGDLDYVKMAVGVLLPYSDADAKQIKESSVYDWRKEKTVRVHWDVYADYLAFNYILYSNSKRYFIKPPTLAWRCRPSYKPGNPEPEVREEAFPKLWEQKPVGLLHLIAESNCRPVHRFAVYALRACKEFCAELDLETVIMLLERPYEVTARLGFDLAKDRYRADDPDLGLVLAVANCASSEARAQAHRWISERRENFLKDGNFITALVTSPHIDTREYARNLLRSSVFAEAASRALIGRLVAYLLTLDESRADEARDIAETVLKTFGPQLRSIGINIVMDLLSHPMLEVQELGGNILLNHDTKADEIPESVIHSLIRSPFESIRAIGIKLFGQLPDEILVHRESLFVAFLNHQLPDIRNAIRPVLKHMVTGSANRDFVRRLIGSLLNALVKPESHEGVHKDLLAVLNDELGESGWMAEVERETVWKLIGAKSQIAQELGGLLLQKHVDWVSEIDTAELVKLNNHEVKAIREAVWAMSSLLLNRLKQSREEMGMAVRLLDSTWDDARKFWFAAFQSSFSGEDYTPGILVSICDSVRADVRKFGRDLITRFFKDEAGQEYLLKLSEHPSADLQLFATNYLEAYASDNPERLKELTPYFLSVLSGVNRGRVAKERIIRFLTAEAQKSEAGARVVAEIFSRQSVTIAIGDKAAAIEAMLNIQHAYPQVPLPIRVKLPEVRKG